LLISDTGWTAYRNGPKYVGLQYGGEPQGNVDIGRIERVNTSACSGDGPTVETGSTPLELWTALKTIDYMTVSQWDPTTVGGISGLSINVDIDQGALAACGSFGEGEVNVFPVGGQTWRAHPGERIRIKSVEVEGKTVTVMMTAEPEAAGSVPQMERFFELADLLLKDVSFQ
jgi:hypothetical protein